MSIIEIIARFSIIFPICIYLFIKPKDKYKWVLFFYVLIFFVEQIAFYYIFVYSQFHNIVTFLSLPTQIVLLYFVFLQAIKSKLYNYINSALFFVFLIIWTYSNWNNDDFNSAIKVTASLIIIVASLFYYYQELQQVNSLFIYTKPIFWGVSGVFIFTAGTFWVFLFKQHYLESDKSFYNQYIVIHGILFIIRNIFISISFILKNKEQLINS